MVWVTWLGRCNCGQEMAEWHRQTNPGTYLATRIDPTTNRDNDV